jgi:hypothetical protein
MEKARLEAYTDWLAILSLTLLCAIGRVPWEWAVGAIASIAGVASVAKGMGKPRGAIFLLAGPAWKAVTAFLGVKGGSA